MTKEEFVRNWDEAERRASSALWAVYSAAAFSVLLVGLAGLVLLATPARLLGAVSLVFAAAVFGAMKVANQTLWLGWLKTNGMICGSCGHVHTAHTGTYLKPHKPGLCTVCDKGGMCRRVKDTGKCDKCAAVIFSRL
jgi:hypothetical protein